MVNTPGAVTYFLTVHVFIRRTNTLENNLNNISQVILGVVHTIIISNTFIFMKERSILNDKEWIFITSVNDDNLTTVRHKALVSQVIPNEMIGVLHHSVLHVPLGYQL